MSWIVHASFCLCRNWLTSAGESKFHTVSFNLCLVDFGTGEDDEHAVMTSMQRLQPVIQVLLGTSFTWGMTAFGLQWASRATS